MYKNNPKRANLHALALVLLLAMTLWFSASAVVPQLTKAWDLTGASQAWLTMSVQIGFVVGALFSASINLSDRFSAKKVLLISVLFGATFNALIPLIDAYTPAIVLRFLTGITLAGVYPTGMKIVASWSKEDRGFSIGLIVAALTLGSALPHLFNAFTPVTPVLVEQATPATWKYVLFVASVLAYLSAFICFRFVKMGPLLASSAVFSWSQAFAGFRDAAPRLANYGYLGHMWELYAMWAWVPLFLVMSFEEAGRSVVLGRFFAFAVVAIGAIGSVLAGKLADQWGRTRLTMISLAISGLCALSAGFFFGQPYVFTIICLIWGFAVVADSAQFSAAVSELSDKSYVGTALTMQTALGFLLTLFTIRMVPPLVDFVGLQWAFAVLALGPIFGFYSMYKLRQRPEAELMASGNK